ncbi:MAG: aspartyl protease family protein [Caulobacterales bacterium]|nr:aspartyl protease family protein [Caulobacterales bacterium]
MISRRVLLSRLAAVAAGGATVWAFRDRLPWPPLEVAFEGGRETPWLPLAQGGGLIEIPVTVAGAPIRAVVDSGAQFSAIDAGLAQRLGLPRTVAAPLLAYGVSGRPQMSHTVTAPLALPGLAIPALRPAALQLADIAFVSGRDFQLLIGRDVLSRLVIEADFPRRRARFLPRPRYHPPPDAVAIPLARKRGGPTAAVQVEAAPPLEVLVDTGATGILSLSEAAARAAGVLAPGRPVSEARSVSLGGLSSVRTTQARTVRVGRLMLRDVEVQVYRPADHAPAVSGLLGAGLLQPFRMALDLSGDRLWLTLPSPLIVPRN